MKVFFGNFMFVLCGLFLFTNCGSVTDPTDYFNHPWLNQPTPSYWPYVPYENFIIKLPPSNYVYIIKQYNVNVEIMNDSYKDEYIRLLQSKRYVKITQEEANRISDNKFTGNSKKYLVVRALYIDSGFEGTYNVIYENNKLFIEFIAHNPEDTTLKEDALIIEVEKIPSSFKITVGVAQYGPD
jgi:hypothetical protein